MSPILVADHTNADNIAILPKQTGPNIHLISSNALNDPWNRCKFADKWPRYLRERACEGNHENKATSSNDFRQYGKDEQRRKTIHHELFVELVREVGVAFSNLHHRGAVRRVHGRIRRQQVIHKCGGFGAVGHCLHWSDRHPCDWIKK